MQMIDHD